MHDLISLFLCIKSQENSHKPDIGEKQYSKSQAKKQIKTKKQVQF